MLLAVDVGNTQTHIGAFNGNEIVDHWRFTTGSEATGDELGSILRNLLVLRGFQLGEIEGAIVSSTVPKLRSQWAEMASRYVEGNSLIVGPGVKTGMPIHIDNPRELGPDRLVNAVAAYERFQGPCIVVDFGTAINFDAVSVEGTYLGGVIAPGLEVSLGALTERAAALPDIQIEQPLGAIGKSTEQAVRAGVVYGYIGLVDGIVTRMRREMQQELEQLQDEPNNIKVIATGGYAHRIAANCSEVEEIDEFLTLSGLRIIWERNI